VAVAICPMPIEPLAASWQALSLAVPESTGREELQVLIERLELPES
jgi:hypothetical protein